MVMECTGLGGQLQSRSRSTGVASRMKGGEHFFATKKTNHRTSKCDGFAEFHPRIHCAALKQILRVERHKNGFGGPKEISQMVKCK